MFGGSILLLILATAGADDGTASPYQGEEAREIKSLAPHEIDALRAGEGMGLAKAAELNGYPGPAHVLELARELGLDEAQIAATRRIEQEMRSAAVEIGRELVAAERQLDRQFAHRTVTAESLEASLDAIGALGAELRRVHLEAHLRQAELLTPAQIREYAALRGYQRGNQDGHEEHH